MKFTAKISKIESAGITWTSTIIIPNEIYSEMIKIAPNKRLICTINGSLTFRCAMMPRKEYHFIMFGKDKIKALNLNTNDKIYAEIFPDKSEFGADVCEEFLEVLYQDPEGKMLFEKLTPGLKRNIIIFISKIKSSQLKIEKTFVFLEHLKKNKGKFNPIVYQEDCRIFREKNTL